MKCTGSTGTSLAVRIQWPELSQSWTENPEGTVRERFAAPASLVVLSFTPSLHSLLPPLLLSLTPSPFMPPPNYILLPRHASPSGEFQR